MNYRSHLPTPSRAASSSSVGASAMNIVSHNCWNVSSRTACLCTVRGLLSGEEWQTTRAARRPKGDLMGASAPPLRRILSRILPPPRESRGRALWQQSTAQHAPPPDAAPRRESQSAPTETTTGSPSCSIVSGRRSAASPGTRTWSECSHLPDGNGPLSHPQLLPAESACSAGSVSTSAHASACAAA